MLLNEFDYELPEELIAQKPIEPRNFSRLMILDPARQTIEHEYFYDLQKFLKAGDTLIFNDTRVIPARVKLLPSVYRHRISSAADISPR